VDIDLREGEVHVLAGENGAGKSTLIKILAGLYDDYSGECQLRDERGELALRRFHSPGEALADGIATIHQELSLVPPMTVADNLFLGRQRKPGKRGLGSFERVDRAAEKRDAERELLELGLRIDVCKAVESYPLATRQMVEVARARACGARLLIFDEATSALSSAEAEKLFELVMRERDQGKGVIYITHKMDEIYRLADRITVLRDGRSMGTFEADDLPKSRLIELMVGRSLSSDLQREKAATRPEGSAVALSVRGLEVRNKKHAWRKDVDDVSFELREGEVLGLAGLEGAGQHRVLEALSGADVAHSKAQLQLCGRPCALREPAGAIANGIVYLPGDRKTQGLIPGRSVRENVSLASLERYRGALALDREREEEDVRRVCEHVQLRARSLEAEVRELSGGNQQKVLLSRCLLARPRVLLLDEPTRGVDIAAKTEIYKLIRSWIDDGVSILLVSSEMSELLQLADRILVFHDGRVHGEFAAEEASAEGILAAAMGHTES